MTALGVGWGAGWVTDFFARLVEPPIVIPSGQPTTNGPLSTPSPTAVVPELFPAITRALDEADSSAGLTSLEVPVAGSGTLVVIPGQSEVTPGVDTRFVRMEIEAGLPFAEEVFADFILATLTDARGWGIDDSHTYARTDGIADIRVVIASPETIATLCARPHEARSARAPEVEPSSGVDASPNVSASATPTVEPSCADLGIVPISAYSWAAGVFAFGEDRTAARQWLVLHGVGHVWGRAEEECDTSVRNPGASVMVDHTRTIVPCTPQQWPFPDALPPVEETEETT